MKLKYYPLLLLSFFACDSDSDMATPSSPESGSVGTGGSLARFTISNDHLYAVDAHRMLTFSLANEMSPSKVDEFDLEWGVETIFAMDTIVFVGTQTGMHMFDISEQSRPAYLSNYEHIQSCDPVVAQDTLAFVTLRSGTSCRNGLDQLDVINISDVKNPQLINSYEMQNPHGLAVDGNLLFVTEGQFGLKVYKILPSGSLELIKFYNEIRSKDIIVQPNDLLIVVAEDGLFQYNYSDINNIRLLSQINIEY